MFAHLVILFDFQFNGFVCFEKGESEIRVKMHTCKLAYASNVANASKSLSFAIFIQIHFEAFEAFAMFAHVVILFHFQFNGFVCFEKGESEIRVKMQTCIRFKELSKRAQVG